MKFYVDLYNFIFDEYHYYKYTIINLKLIN
jgi:hypothetical protein